MTLADLELVADWSTNESWNPGLHDERIFFSSYPEGFFLGELDGQPAASVSAVAYDDGFGFMGFLLVKPEHRGKGLAKRMGVFGVAQLEPRVIGADALPPLEDAFLQYGFSTAFSTLRFVDSVGGTCPGRSVGALLRREVIPLSEVPFDWLLGYDRLCFPGPRPQFLRDWIAQPGGRALGAVEDGKLVGYGAIRPCRLGFKLGPLFAERPDIAEKLYDSLAIHGGGEPVFWDVPDNNREALRIARGRSLPQVLCCARMYRNGQPRWSAERVFGLTSLDLG
jgi:GNAT superfamily N-acetyltransferase